MDVLSQSPLLAFVLKMAVMPVSALALWGNFRWLQQKFARQGLLPGVAETLPQAESRRLPPGEVAQLIILSMAQHPWKWRLQIEGWLVWSRSPEQGGEVELHYDHADQMIRVDGLLGETMLFSQTDQAWLFEAINGLKSTIKAMRPLELPPGLGEVACQIITSIKLKPNCWRQLEPNWFSYSARPFTKVHQAEAQIWVGSGKNGIDFSADSGGETLEVEFTSRERAHIWEAYQEWRQQHQSAIADREIALTKSILSGKTGR